MAGKIKYDIVRDGLTCHFDAANKLSISNYLEYAGTGNVNGSILNIAKTKQEWINTYQTSYYIDTTIPGDGPYRFPNYNQSNCGWFDFSSGSKDLLHISSNGLPNTLKFDDEFTVSIWLKTTSDGKFNPILQYANDFQSGSLIMDEAGFLLIYSTNIPGGEPNPYTGWNWSATQLQTNKWYNISLNFELGTENNDLYINGYSDKISYQITSSATIEPLYIANTFDFGFDARTNFGISSISFYNRKLTESEVIQNYRALKYRFEGEIGLPYIDDFDNLIF